MSSDRLATVNRDRRHVRASVAAVLGNVVEWFDFIAYGILATQISRAFFPGGKSETGLLATYALFGLGFVLRPAGGFVIGWIGDKYGRKPAFILAVVTMASGTFAVACIPSYAAIGVAAPLLLLAARLAQGFAAGGEWGTAVSFIAEWAPGGRRGFFGSFLSMGVASAGLFASAMVAGIAMILPAQAMAAWGWRIPFLAGGVLGICSLWVRLRVDETPIYSQFKRKAFVPPARPARSGFVSALTVFGMTIHWSVCFYIFLVYLPTYTQVQAHLGQASVAWSNAISLVVLAILIPPFGWLSDRYGRKPFLLASCVMVAAITLPAFWLIAATKSFAVVIVVQILLGMAIACYSGPGPAFMAELLPTCSRALGAAFPYALAAALFGGFAPFIADWLIEVTGMSSAPAAYVMLAALVSFLVIRRHPETLGTSFR